MSVDTKFNKDFGRRQNNRVNEKILKHICFRENFREAHILSFNMNGQKLRDVLKKLIHNFIMIVESRHQNYLY